MAFFGGGKLLARPISTVLGNLPLPEPDNNGHAFGSLTFWEQKRKDSLGEVSLSSLKAMPTWVKPWKSVPTCALRQTEVDGSNICVKPPLKKLKCDWGASSSSLPVDTVVVLPGTDDVKSVEALGLGMEEGIPTLSLPEDDVFSPDGVGDCGSLGLLSAPVPMAVDVLKVVGQDDVDIAQMGNCPCVRTCVQSVVKVDPGGLIALRKDMKVLTKAEGDMMLLHMVKAAQIMNNLIQCPNKVEQPQGGTQKQQQCHRPCQGGWKPGANVG